jgi:hypothetical protein
MSLDGDFLNIPGMVIQNQKTELSSKQYNYFPQIPMTGKHNLIETRFRLVKPPSRD